MQAQVLSQIIPPPGGRVHILRVPVNPSRDWNEAINAAGPDTPKSYDVRKVGRDLYPPQAGEPKEQEIILVNFGKTIPNGQHVLDWAKSFGLRPVSPRAVFSVLEHNPELNQVLKMAYMAVVSLDVCSFEGERRVCVSWWDDAERKAYLFWFDYDWRDFYWFAFVRELPPTA